MYMTTVKYMHIAVILLVTFTAGILQDFWSQWLQSVPDIGLLWLHSLTRDREQQVGTRISYALIK